MKTKYFMEDGRYKAVTKNKKKTIKMGDTIRVKVVSTDLQNRQIELKMV